MYYSSCVMYELWGDAFGVGKCNLFIYEYTRTYTNFYHFNS